MVLLTQGNCTSPILLFNFKLQLTSTMADINMKQHPQMLLTGSKKRTLDDYMKP